MSEQCTIILSKQKQTQIKSDTKLKQHKYAKEMLNQVSNLSWHTLSGVGIRGSCRCHLLDCIRARSRDALYSRQHCSGLFFQQIQKGTPLMYYHLAFLFVIGNQIFLNEYATPELAVFTQLACPGTLHDIYLLYIWLFKYIFPLLFCYL